MSSTEVKGWLPTTVASTRKKDLVEQIIDVVEQLYNEDVDNAKTLATSTTKDDSWGGTVEIDKTLLAAMVKKLAPASDDPEDLVNLKVSDIKRRLHYAQKHLGVDRLKIAARKAEYLAIQSAEPAGEQDDQGLNGRRDSDDAPDSDESSAE